MKKVPEVIYRHCEDMEHIVIYQGGTLISDEYEGFPKLTSKEVLECLAKHGLIELKEEEITESE